MKENRKALVITGISVDRLKELKKQYTTKYKKTISYNDIVSKLIINAKFEDIDTIWR